MIHEEFWDGIFALAEKYDISLTNNMPSPEMPLIADFGKDVLDLYERVFVRPFFGELTF